MSASNKRSIISLIASRRILALLLLCLQLQVCHRPIVLMVLCDPNGKLIKEAEGICWGEILKEPAYSGGEFESIFWVREAKCTYGEFNKEQLSKLGSRGKAARAIAPSLRNAFELNN